jgi:hypothetical protein
MCKGNKMNILPPNDPNQNNNGRNSQNNNKDDPNVIRRNEDGVDVFGNLRDQPVVVVMFLIGFASWLLKEHCTC